MFFCILSGNEIVINRSNGNGFITQANIYSAEDLFTPYGFLIPQSGYPANTLLYGIHNGVFKARAMPGEQCAGHMIDHESRVYSVFVGTSKELFMISYIGKLSDNLEIIGSPHSEYSSYYEGVIAANNSLGFNKLNLEAVFDKLEGKAIFYRDHLYFYKTDEVIAELKSKGFTKSPMDINLNTETEEKGVK